MKSGEWVERELIITEEMIDGFAEVTGDYNPIHMKNSEISEIHQEKRIVHGILLNGLLSAMMGISIPGTMIMDQVVTFCHPVYLGDKVTLRITMQQVEKRFRHNIGTLLGQCIGEDGSVRMTMTCHQLMPVMKGEEE